MQFELLLTVLTLFSFLFWVLYKWQKSEKTSGWVYTIQSLFGVLLLVLILRSFLFEPFRIPSSSMRPTLIIGDFVLVNKFIYGLRLPVSHTKIVDINQPERGDIIVFRYPVDPRTNYIKRVVGVPGDLVEVRGKQLFINNKQVTNNKIGTRSWSDQRCNQHTAAVFNSKLPGKTHRTMQIAERPVEREGEWVVPGGKYFVMGDNRDNSQDSRYWGFVPEENLVGKAQAIWFNLDLSGFDFDLFPPRFDFSDYCGKGLQLERIGGVESNV